MTDETVEEGDAVLDDSEIMEADEEGDDANADDDEPIAVANEVVDGKDEDDEGSAMEDHTEHTEHGEDEEEDLTVKSQATEESQKTPKQTQSSLKRTSPRRSTSTHKKGRAPSVAGLTIPFRTVKKAMKLDPDIPIVQNEAAIMATVATELFLKRLAKDSLRNAKMRGRNTIRYEDVAEARTKKKAFSFMDTLLP